MFLVLGLLVSPTRLASAAFTGLGVALLLAFVARPAAVALCLAPFRYRVREVACISWVGLRGAVAIFLASIPLLVGLPGAYVYFDVAFVVVFAIAVRYLPRRVTGAAKFPLNRCAGESRLALRPTIPEMPLQSFSRCGNPQPLRSA